MSYANYGPTFRTQSVTNLIGAINIPIVADGGAVTVTPLLKTVGNVEIPIVLGEGTWAVQAKAAMNPSNAAGTYQYIQCRLVGNGGEILTSSAPIFGADCLNGTNIDLYFDCTSVVFVAPGVVKTIVYRAYVTGNTEIVNFIADYSNITATKLSA
jgi:hypothetical protein